MGRERREQESRDEHDPNLRGESQRVGQGHARVVAIFVGDCERRMSLEGGSDVRVVFTPDVVRRVSDFFAGAQSGDRPDLSAGGSEAIQELPLVIRAPLRVGEVPTAAPPEPVPVGERVVFTGLREGLKQRGESQTEFESVYELRQLHERLQEPKSPEENVVLTIDLAERETQPYGLPSETGHGHGLSARELEATQAELRATPREVEHDPLRAAHEELVAVRTENEHLRTENEHLRIENERLAREQEALRPAPMSERDERKRARDRERQARIRAEDPEGSRARQRVYQQDYRARQKQAGGGEAAKQPPGR